MSNPHAESRLIVTIEVGAGAPERLSAVLAAVKIASVIVAPVAQQALDAAGAMPLVAAAQKAGAAALIQDDARLARTLKADGVHLPVCDSPDAAFSEARDIVGGQAIVGMDAGRSRHDAMSAGEDGADYVGFGIPAFVKERDEAIERRAEMIAWWGDIFEVPCVAFDVESAEEARRLALLGADFVEFRIAAGQSPADARDRAEAFAHAADDGARQRKAEMEDKA